MAAGLRSLHDGGGRVNVQPLKGDRGRLREEKEKGGGGGTKKSKGGRRERREKKEGPRR